MNGYRFQPGVHQTTMNKTFLLSLTLLCCSFASWQHDLDSARQQALKEHKHILLNFSGSDWCGPCMRMNKEIFENPGFTVFADSVLIMVNADFPRKKKNQLPVKQQDLNNTMADHYNSNGIFPYTVLMNGNGKILKSWEGFPNLTASQFTAEIKKLLNADQ